jgi:hypothetical protein
MVSFVEAILAVQNRILLYNQGLGSETFSYGSRPADPYHWITAFDLERCLDTKFGFL